MNSSCIRVGGVVAVVLCWAVVGAPIRGQGPAAPPNPEPKTLEKCSKVPGPFPENCATESACEQPVQIPGTRGFYCAGISIINVQVIQKCGSGEGAATDNCKRSPTPVPCCSVGLCELDIRYTTIGPSRVCRVKKYKEMFAETAEWGGPCLVEAVTK
jgi:hypothetical protein